MNERKRPTIAELVADHKGTEAALQKAFREAVLAHARAGNPVATWRDGKVVWISPEEVFATFGVNGEPSPK
jgi:hypothetical protein